MRSGRAFHKTCANPVQFSSDSRVLPRGFPYPMEDWGEENDAANSRYNCISVNHEIVSEVILNW